jgi:hypothetical protein
MPGDENPATPPADARSYGGPESSNFLPRLLPLRPSTAEILLRAAVE